LRGEIGRVVDQIVLFDLMALSRNERASAQTRALAAAELTALKAWLAAAAGKTRDPAERAHLAYGEQQIGEFQKDPAQLALPLALPPATPPDGPPIGSPFDDEE
jgi:hypothetical protein